MNLQDLQYCTWGGRGNYVHVLYDVATEQNTGDYAEYSGIRFLPRHDNQDILQAVNSDVVICMGGQRTQLQRHWQASINESGEIQLFQIKLDGKPSFNFNLVAVGEGDNLKLEGRFKSRTLNGLGQYPQGTCVFTRIPDNTGPI